jgi:hypothetical protein
MVGTRPATPEVSHGRGGAGNIAVDDTKYVDGEVVRAGPEGSHADGAFSTGRGGKRFQSLSAKRSYSHDKTRPWPVNPLPGFRDFEAIAIFLPCFRLFLRKTPTKLEDQALEGEPGPVTVVG